MDLGSVCLILALFILVAYFVMRPLFDPALQPTTPPQSSRQVERSALLAERDRLLRALQDLDFDHALGKIPADEYPRQRAAWVSRGAEVLRRLDELPDDGDQTAPGIAAARPESAPAAEAEVVGGLAQPDPPESPAAIPLNQPDDAIELLLANRRRARQKSMVGFCPQCGGAVAAADRFCPKCGSRQEI